MKKIPTIMLATFVISLFASCGSSPYKKRKGCRGNGSWSGNRNLGYITPFPKQKNDSKKYYVRALDDNPISIQN